MTRTTRYATAAVVGCFYTALVVWLVGAEAQSYRKSLRRERDRGRGSTPVGAVATTPPLAPLSPGPAAPPPVPPVPVAVPSVPDATVARNDSRGATQPALPPTNQAAPAPSPSTAPAPAQPE